MPLLDHGSPRLTPLDRLRRRSDAVRRAVLRRRRLLAALCVAVAVGAGLSAASGPPAETVGVRVASRDLPAGTVLSGDDLRTVRFRPGSVPDGLAERVSGRVLAAPLRRGEPVTEVRLVGPSLTEGRPGVVAAPVRLPDAGMVALLEVGDAVDLVAADPQAGGAETVAYDVPVLALPQPRTSGGAPGGSGAGPGSLGGRIVVLGLEPAEVTEVADAAARSLVTFTWAPQ